MWQYFTELPCSVPLKVDYSLSVVLSPGAHSLAADIYNTVWPLPSPSKEFQWSVIILSTHIEATGWGEGEGAFKAFKFASHQIFSSLILKFHY